VTEGGRDAGLVRSVGPWVLAASIANTVVGGGIFAAPSALAAGAGVYAPLLFLACAVPIGGVAVCFAEGGSRVPTSGGPYGCIEAAFGTLAGYVTGMLLLVSEVLACGGVAAALADTVTAGVGSRSLRGPLHAAVIVLVILGLALVNVGGVRRAARILGAIGALKIVPLAVFVLAGAAAVRGANLFHGGGLRSSGRALILALFTLMGMETALGTSGEVARPSRTIPRALGLAMLSLAALFVAIQVVAQGILGDGLAGSRAPLADAMAEVHPALRALLLGGAALSMFGYVGNDLLGSPRLFFALARDGWFPRAFAVTHPRTHVPHVAILVYAGVALTLALTGTFEELAVLAALASVPIYLGGCAAAWALARRGVARAGEPLGFRGIGAAAVTGIVGTSAIAAMASLAEIAGLLGLVAVCAAVYGVVGRLRRETTRFSS
jgi:basic amino acid/polyamine antiporter, APA family